MTADPEAGEPNVIRRTATRLLDRAEDVSSGGVQLATLVGLVEQDWEGAAGRQFVRLAESFGPGARRTAACIDETAAALAEYAAEVAAIQDEARALRRLRIEHEGRTGAHSVSLRIARGIAERADAVESDIERLRRLENDGTALADEAVRLERQWDELEARRARADRRAAGRLQSDAVVGRATSFRTEAPALSDAGFLAALGALPPEQLAALVADAGVRLRLAGMPPALVAEWWDRLGGPGSADEHSAQQAALIAALPSVIGNLDGVASWARDRANRAVLARDLERATAEVAELQRRYAGARPEDRPAAGQALAAVLRRWTMLRNLAAGARMRFRGLPSHPVQLLAYRPGTPPLGATAIGDLDAAEHVTYFVPGMGSSLGDTTHYMRANANLLQRLDATGVQKTASVVWLGYEAPPAVAADVLFERHARTGAAALVQDLEAFRTRNAPARLHVLGHSYGSTLGALALAAPGDAGVRSFVTIGSAGMPAGVTSVDQLGADRVFAVQGDEDIAGLGRSLSRRRDPIDIGAVRLDAGADGEFAGVNAHGVLVHDDDRHRDAHGYLDDGTNSLRQIAEALR